MNRQAVKSGNSVTLETEKESKEIHEEKMDYIDFNDLGKKLNGTRILSITGATTGSEDVVIVTNLRTLILFHSQDCCENVYVEDVTGDPQDLIGGIIGVMEERIQERESYGLSLWTFYEVRTTQGDITIRWLGESNGYYSVSVSYTWEDTEPCDEENDNSDLDCTGDCDNN